MSFNNIRQFTEGQYLTATDRLALAALPVYAVRRAGDPLALIILQVQHHGF